MVRSDKAVTYYFGTGVLWLLATVLGISLSIRFSQAPISYSVAAFIMGLAVWAVVGWFWAKKTLRRIENPPAPKGLASPKRFVLVLAVGLLVCSLFATGTVLLLEFWQPWFFIISFFAALPVAYFSSATVFRRWQKRTRRVLYIKSGIISPAPVVNTVDYKETVY